MSGSGATEWRALPAALSRDELASWCSLIPGPVAVTGATGFIGSHVVDALLQGGVPLRLLVREPGKLAGLAGAAEVVAGDLNREGALSQLLSGCRGVVHVAGLVRSASPAAFDLANRAGTERLVETLARTAPDARLVHLSSLAAAGPSPDPGGVGPEAPPQPISAYGRSKLAGEAAVRAHPGVWVILRPPTTYGPRETDVLQFFRLVAKGLVPYPSGERLVTVAYVADVVRAVLAALAGAGDRRTLHLGAPAPGTVRNMLESIAEAGGMRIRALPVPPFLVRAIALGGDVLHLMGARRAALTSDKARELLARHWVARTEDSLRALGVGGTVSLRDGFAATWAWYREAGWVPHAKIRTRTGLHSERG